MNVDRLILKLSGISQQEEKHLAQLVSTRLAHCAITMSSIRNVSSLQMSITAHPNANMDKLANQIVSEILRHLNQTLA